MKLIKESLNKLKICPICGMHFPLFDRMGKLAHMELDIEKWKINIGYGKKKKLIL